MGKIIDPYSSRQNIWKNAESKIKLVPWIKPPHQPPKWFHNRKEYNRQFDVAGGFRKNWTCSYYLWPGKDLQNILEIWDHKRLPQSWQTTALMHSFITNSNFQVLVGSTLSEWKNQGVPQSNIITYVNPEMDCSLYVEDFFFFFIIIRYRSQNMHTIGQQLQQYINRIQKICNQNSVCPFL